MREFLISSMPAVLCLITVFDTVFICAMIRQYRSDRSRIIPLLTALLCVGLFYDSLILALGRWLQFGTVFKVLSQFRYILHCTLIPLLFPLCAYSLGAGKKTLKAVWAVTAVIMVLGLIASLQIQTEPRVVGEIGRYAEADTTGKFADTVVQFLDIVPVFFMMGAGIVLIIKKKNPHMLLSGFFMFLFTMLGIFLGKDPSGDRTKSLMFFISMFGECLMVLHLYLFTRRQSRED